MYLIEEITYKDGSLRTGGRYPYRIGERVELMDEITEGNPMLLQYVEQDVGTSKFLRTSRVVTISHAGKDLIVETMNSIYKLKAV